MASPGRWRRFAQGAMQQTGGDEGLLRDSYDLKAPSCAYVWPAQAASLPAERLMFSSFVCRRLSIPCHDQLYSLQISQSLRSPNAVFGCSRNVLSLLCCAPEGAKNSQHLLVGLRTRICINAPRWVTLWVPIFLPSAVGPTTAGTFLSCLAVCEGGLSSETPNISSF